ncbi:hypothetical protein ACWEOW_17320 [Monashia sp. NPDC004114]
MHGGWTKGDLALIKSQPDLAAQVPDPTRRPSVEASSAPLTCSSRIDRHLEYCVIKYGCYADTYPWAQFTIHGNGTWAYTGADS